MVNTGICTPAQFSAFMVAVTEGLFTRVSTAWVNSESHAYSALAYEKAQSVIIPPTAFLQSMISWEKNPEVR